MSSLVGGFSVETISPGLIKFDELFASLAIDTAQHFWILVLIAVTWRVLSIDGHLRTQHDDQLLLLFLSPLFTVGVMMDSLVTGWANTHEYFSGPNYFLALAIALTMAPYLVRKVPGGRSGLATVIWCFAGLMAVAALEFVKQIPLPDPLERATLKNAITDGRALLGLAIFGVSLKRTGPRRQQVLPIAVVLLLCVSIIEGVSPRVSRLIDLGIRPTRPAESIEASIGSSDVRVVGSWIRENTEPTDVIATNHLYWTPRSGVYSDDYSLGMWSHREFLVLGPKFFGQSESAAEETDLSIRFGANPTLADAKALYDRGVRWFVIDTAETHQNSWVPFATIAYRTQRFMVLKLANNL